MQRLFLVVLAAILICGCSDATEADGPVIISGLSADSDGEDAEAVGTIVLNGGCLELHTIDGIFSVEWPDGTTWDEDEAAVVLLDGRRVSDGGSIRAGGGYRDKSTQGCDTTTAVVLNGDPSNIEIS